MAKKPDRPKPAADDNRAAIADTIRGMLVSQDGLQVETLSVDSVTWEPDQAPTAGTLLYREYADPWDVYDGEPYDPKTTTLGLWVGYDKDVGFVLVGGKVKKQAVRGDVNSAVASDLLGGLKLDGDDDLVRDPAEPD